MYTQCPHCRTIFRIGASQLAQAHGQARCGACKQAFDTLITLADHPDLYGPEISKGQQPCATEFSIGSNNALAAAAPNNVEIAADLRHSEPLSQNEAPPHINISPQLGPVPETLQLEPSIVTIDMPPTPITVVSSDPAPSVLVAENVAPDSNSEVQPQLSAVSPSKRQWNTVFWITANVILILVLLGQYAYFQREALAQYPSLRPWLTELCGLAGCELSLRRDPSRLSLTQRSVQTDPAHPNALHVDVVLINDADFWQPYPLLELRFSDLNGHTVAGRRFLPREYLATGIEIGKGMPPHQPVSAQIEVADPGPNAAGFQFELL